MSEIYSIEGQMGQQKIVPAAQFSQTSFWILTLFKPSQTATDNFTAQVSTRNFLPPEFMSSKLVDPDKIQLISLGMRHLEV